jgi:hypothetical protein
MRAYHFLAAEHGLSDLALKRIRISRYADLNDPFELLGADMTEGRHRHAVGVLRDYFEKNLGLVCFSKHWSNPVLWSHYATKHRGMCLGFDIQDSFVSEVNYTNTRLPIEYVDGDPAKGVARSFVTTLIRTKFSHWRYEEEVRAGIQLDHSTVENGSYFVPFSPIVTLTEVILGPLCDLPLTLVKELVDSLYDRVTITRAMLSPVDFAVVAREQVEAGRATRREV